MSTTALKPGTMPIPVHLSAPEFPACLLPHLARPKRGPQGPLGSPRVLHLLRWLLYTGRQCQGWPVPQDAHGPPAMPDTTVYTVWAKGAAAGARWHACVASVAQLSAEQLLARRGLQGAGTNTGANTGALAWATRATRPRQGRRASP